MMRFISSSVTGPFFSEGSEVAADVVVVVAITIATSVNNASAVEQDVVCLIP